MLGGVGSENFVSPNFVSAGLTLDSYATGNFVSGAAETTEELRASGSSQAGIFTSSASKSNVDAPGAGFVFRAAGVSKLVSESLVWNSAEFFADAVS